MVTYYYKLRLKCIMYITHVNHIYVILKTCIIYCTSSYTDNASTRATRSQLYAVVSSYCLWGVGESYLMCIYYICTCTGWLWLWL